MPAVRPLDRLCVSKASGAADFGNRDFRAKFPAGREPGPEPAVLQAMTYRAAGSTDVDATRMSLSAITDRPGFRFPPVTVGVDGVPRHVGVELEFGSITAREAASALQGIFGGRSYGEDDQDVRVSGSEIGDFTVKLDTRYAHPADPRDGWMGRLRVLSAKYVGKAARYVVPSEFVTAPLPMHDLPKLERAVDALRKAGASGTFERSLFAFAVHLNPEVPKRDVETVVAIMKAFVGLDDWLRESFQPKRLRRALGFASPYPEAYRRRLMDPAYWPDVDTLIDAYIDANPTRNRDLDMLPLLLNLDEERVRRRLPKEKIGNRPAFHYRLPGARLGDPDWCIAAIWNGWVAVEALAADRERLDLICRSYRAFSGSPAAWGRRSAALAFGGSDSH